MMSLREEEELGRGGRWSCGDVRGRAPAATGE